MSLLPEPGLVVLPDVNDHGKSLTLCSGSTIIARIKPRNEEEYQRDEAIFARLAACYTLPADEDEIAAAREEYGCDEIEIDDGAGVSHGDDGTWVQAWVLVSATD